MIGQAYLQRLSAALDGVVAECAERVAVRARELAPGRTGCLHSSIRADGNTVIAAAPHAAAVELGSGKRSAQPFLRPALRGQQSLIRNLIEQTLVEDSNG